MSEKKQTPSAAPLDHMAAYQAFARSLKAQAKGSRADKFNKKTAAKVRNSR